MILNFIKRKIDYQDRAILLCANKNFYKKFNDEGFAQNGVHIRGKAKKIDSFPESEKTPGSRKGPGVFCLTFLQT